ncbi:MAG: HAMP domain-containing protein [Candidatus Hydrogenedens sp.]|nr:HAMP domain-containing protein [Candidatus Hydrogenedentota bacterium]NLF56456.1 HAMP domain-containing protein [Candidatus Hydrogenedens sp.]
MAGGFTIGRYVFVSYLLVILAALLFITGLTSNTVGRLYSEHILKSLEAQAGLAREMLLAEPELAEDPDGARALCDRIHRATGTRVSLVLPSGAVIADTDRPAETLDNHADRGEIRDALALGGGKSERFSATLRQNMIYKALAVPGPPEAPRAVVRLAMPVTEARAALGRVRLIVLAAGGLASLLAVAVSMAVSRFISRPLNEMKAGMQRYARGDFSSPIRLARPVEIASLCEAMNGMAEQLDDRIRTIIKDRNQQEAVLSSMVEGVIAVDNQGRIVSHNDAAVRLTGIPFGAAPGALLRDVASGTPLHQFVAQILDSARPRESEFGSLSQGGRILQVHGSVLRDARGQGMGAVVVLNDVTRLRRLEQVRRDFVANVSHELRTPITSIKGFVETLLDGALDDPADARHFLEIVAKQSDRLNAILGDLLTLSRIEEGEEKASIELEVAPVRDTLENAVQLCAKKAAAKEIELVLDCGAETRARINPSLLEQAVSNLIDNAVKYSPSGSRVLVAAAAGRDGVAVRVEDRGCGIAAEHVPRLFERFYRVDKARSRSLGGTGLGLAIVKHVVTAHGGRVSVESVPGAGSTFSIHLPPP